MKTYIFSLINLQCININYFFQLDSESCGNKQGLNDYSVANYSRVIREDMPTMSSI